MRQTECQELVHGLPNVNNVLMFHEQFTRKIHYKSKVFEILLTSYDVYTAYVP